MDDAITKELINETIFLVRTKVIPISSKNNAEDFEHFATKLEKLIKLTNQQDLFNQEFDAIKYWVSDSCPWTNEFLEVYNLFEKLIKKEIKNNA